MKPVTVLSRAGVCLLLAVATLLLPSESVGYTVRPHPRILINSDTLPMLRQRCQTTHASIFAQVQSIVDDRMAEGRKDTRYIDDFAFVWLMTQDPVYLDYAVEALLYNVDAGYEIAGEGSGPARISSCVLAYDWLYNDMSQADRDHVAQKFVSTVVNDAPDGTWYAWIPDEDYWHYALGIYGDGVADQAAVEGFQASYNQYFNRFIPALDEVGTYGAADGYAGKRTMLMFTIAEALYTALGEDWRSTSSFVRNSGDFWMHRQRADRNISRNPGKWNMANTSLPIYFSYFASRFNNPYWQANANYWVNDTSSWGRLDAYQLVLWYDPSLPAQSTPDTLSYYDSGAGHVLMRNSWDMSPASTAIHAAFFNGPDLVRSYTQNHFLIARGGDNLLIDSGLRSSDIDNHYYPYYVRAIAHNAILIDDPNESLGDYLNHIGKRHDVPNEGDQQESDHGEGLLHWPNADGTYGYRGEITMFRDTGDYVYVRGDASAAYASSKASRVVRDFFYLRPDIFVIRDQVTRTNPTFKTKAVFHMIDRPDVEGPLSVIQGSLSTGGIFESSSAREAIATRGASQAQVLFLLPDATGGTLRIVGGGNANGEPWKQDWEPAFPLTYDPSTSYEFWVDDRNWVSCSQYCQQSQIDTRNDQPGNEAGDWRVEIEAPDGDTELTFVTVIKAGPLGESGVSAEYRRNATGEMVIIARAPGDTLTVPFPFEGDQGINY